MSTPEQLDRLLREWQAERRLPSVAAAVVRRGVPAWSAAVGSADLEDDVGATPQTQYRVGSVTKTFTAVAVMQLGAAGELDLDDRLEQHLDVPANGTPTIRRLLCHLSGLQREVGDMWITGASPTETELIESLTTVEQVLPGGSAFHYSNLAFALLGRLVAAKTGERYQDVVDERIVRPLGLARTTWQPQPPKAVGYLVDEYASTARREPERDFEAVASAAQLWSTVEDLARWAAFLADGDDGVLPAGVVERMWSPQVMEEPDDWSRGFGLSLELRNTGERILGGHRGAMPGHLAAVFVDRKSGIGAAALTNAGTRGALDELAAGLIDRADELWPAPVEPWRPEGAPPADVARLLGRWWSEGNEFVFSWRDGALHAGVATLPPGRGETRFERDGDGWRAARGREQGERLRVDGERLSWGGYAFTREQRSFDEL